MDTNTSTCGEPVESNRLDRRSAIKWMLTASAALPFLSQTLAQSGPAIPTPGGYGHDPNLLAPEIPWDRTLTKEQLKTTAALCDVILPRVDDSPSASELNVPDFIDEWVSRSPRPAIRSRSDSFGPRLDQPGIEQALQKPFHDLTESQKTAICDDIAYLPEVNPNSRIELLFAKHRNLTMGGYYTSDYGTKEVGYVGNVALAKFDGPPPEVLKFLGVDKATLVKAI